MDDSRPRLTAHAAEIFDVMEQRIHQRAALVPRRRVHHHPRGFVEHHDVGVLEHDPKGQRFWLERRGPQVRHIDDVLFPPLHLCAGAQRRSRPRDFSFLDEALNLGPGLPREYRREKRIEAQSVVFRLDHQRAGRLVSHTATPRGPLRPSLAWDLSASPARSA
jgi:hypothetical protein